jgi:4-hydroxy-tetrahydrodipicolinate reductase
MALRIAVAGATGRMGRLLVEAVSADPAFELVGALVREGAASLGQDAGASAGRTTGVTLTDDLEAALSSADCLIDFTRPDVALRHLEACRSAGVKLVLGTTGFDADDKRKIAHAAERIGIVFAPNMSVGVNAAFKLIEQAARILAADASGGFDIEIIEAHHRAKIDAPSGTALRMGEIAAKAVGRKLGEVAIFGREGVTGPRQTPTIGFATVRGGDIVGDHTVMFAGLGERLEITHRASSRMTYAVGSLKAARFLASRPPGLYDMQDVLGLR